MSVLHPVATNAAAALAAPLGRAAREREAAALAGGEVRFTVEATGPAFATRDAALAAWGARVEPGTPEDRWCELRETTAERRAPMRPAFQDGRRWPAPQKAPATVWRLSVAYWRVVGADEAAPLDQARALRRKTADLDAKTLRRLARQPLQPVRPQQPLDLGLFEARLPENPDIVVADE